MSAALRQGELPPQALNAAQAAFVLDRLPQLLVDGLELTGRSRIVVKYARETKEVAWKLRATGVQDEGAAHSEDTAEEPSFEDYVVSRRRLTGFRGIGWRWAVRGPVILTEYESRKVDFARKLEEPLQCGDPGIERRRPGLYPRDVSEPTSQPLQDLVLLS